MKEYVTPNIEIWQLWANSEVATGYSDVVGVSNSNDHNYDDLEDWGV